MSSSQSSSSRHEAPKLPLHSSSSTSRHEDPKLSLHSGSSRQSHKPNRPLQGVSRTEANTTSSHEDRSKLAPTITSSATSTSSATTSRTQADLPTVTNFMDLNTAIQCLDWDGDRELRDHLWDRYLHLMESGQPIPDQDMGTEEFWDAIWEDCDFDGNQMDQDEEEEEDMDIIMTEAARQVEQQQRDAAAAGGQRGRRLVDYSDSEDSDSEEGSQTGGGGIQSQQGPPAPLPIIDHFTISEGWRVYVKKYKIHGKAYHVQLKNQDQIQDLQAIMIEILRQTMAAAFKDADPTDEVGVEFRHPGIRKGYYDVPFQPRSKLTPERLYEILVMLLGYDDINLDDDFKIIITRIPQTRGTGLPWETDKDWEAFRKSHTHAFIEINNQDNLCLPRALVVAKARLDKETDPEVNRKWDAIRKGDQKNRPNANNLQKKMAQDLARRAGLQNHQGAYGEEEIRKLQDVLEPEYQIKIISRQCLNTITFAGKIPSDKVLYIYHRKRDSDDPGHYCVLTKPHKLFGDCSYWCNQCDRAFSTTYRHKCPSKCNCCFKLKLCPFTGWKHCKDCNRSFRGEECFQNHKTVAQPRGENKKQKVNKSICEKFKICEKCGRMISFENGKKHLVNGVMVPFHQCGHYYCRNCDMNHPDGTYECYMQKVKDKKKKMQEKPKDKEEDIFDLLGGGGDEEEVEEEEGADERGVKIFFDFESNQSTIIGENKLGPVFEHIPDYCHVFMSCNMCREEKQKGEIKKCVNCGDGERIFKGETCKEDFCSWLFSADHRGATALAHNNKGYDGLFLVQYLISRCKTPKVISKGREFMKIEWGQVRVIDSLNFFPMGLSDLPKAFNIPELKKGYFPHRFDRIEHAGYVGRIPAAWFYDPGNMKPEKRKQFYAWYGKQLNKEFHLERELAEYCRSDVMILMRSCLRFEMDMEKLLDVRPFDVGVTIASACMHIFRKKFMKEGTIGLIPHGGYRGRENQSIQGLKWLKWVSEVEDIYIQHAGNGKEKRIGNYKVDGFHAASNTVYEYNGCVWHGHTCRKDRKMKVPNSRKTMEEAYQDTLHRKADLENKGYAVVEKWECELKKELDEDPEMKQFFKDMEIREPLDVKEALRGGRTNAIRLYYKCKPGEKMHYVDFVSLYPWGVKWTEFPVGHPIIITENFKPIKAGSNPYFGLIKCRILPPKKLFHPVLPYKCGGKLMFPLCRSCAEEQRQGFCTHRDSERALTGEWVTSELNKALEKGYKIVEVHEVWHYPNTEKHNGRNEKTGLFTPYINFFLKLKIEASGWPVWVKTEEDKAKFIRLCQEVEGITLDPQNIQKNPGMRMIAKLCLNSFWGKFGQRSNMAKDEFIKDAATFADIIFDQRNIVENVRVINEEIVHVTYKKEEEFAECLPYMNKVIAAFTTANCRLHLYEELEKLGARVCYMDTDSVIYVTGPGDTYHPKLGSFLGEMTDELEEYGVGSYIKEFVSGGPKNYGFRVRKPNGRSETKVKIRGFTLNYHAANKLNLETLKKKVFDFVEGEVQEKMMIVQPQIARTADRRVVTQDVGKQYGISYDKRWVLPDYTTLPYGTCEKD